MKLDTPKRRFCRVREAGDCFARQMYDAPSVLSIPKL